MKIRITDQMRFVKIQKGLNWAFENDTSDSLEFNVVAIKDSFSKRKQYLVENNIIFGLFWINADDKCIMEIGSTQEWILKKHVSCELCEKRSPLCKNRDKIILSDVLFPPYIPDFSNFFCDVFNNNTKAAQIIYEMRKKTKRNFDT